MSLKTILNDIKYGKGIFFIKSFFHNVRHYSFRYFVIFLSEVVMIVLSLCANGIMIDSIAGYNGADSYAKSFYFKFEDETITAGENESSNNEWRTCGSLRDKFSGFNEMCTADIKDMTIRVKNNPEGMNYFTVLWNFSSYEEMTERWLEITDAPLPTKEQFENHENVCYIGEYQDEDKYDSYTYTDDVHIRYGDKEYLVLGTIKGNQGFHIFYGTEPESLTVEDVFLTLKDYPTESQVKEISELFMQIFNESTNGLGRVTVRSSPKDFGLLEVKMSFANILITALIQVIAIFNVMLIFRYIVSMRKKEFAVYRLCGFSKRACILSSLCEIMCISLICSVISFAVFELIKPALAEQFSAVSVSFDFGYYLLILIGYLVLTAIIFTVYIAPALNKSVVNELKGGQAL